MINDTTKSVARSRGACAASAATVGLVLLVLPCGAQVSRDGFGQGPGIRSTTAAMASTPDSGVLEAATVIRPFSFRASDQQLAELRRRVAETRWPEKETVADHSQGLPLAAMRELARYWATDYDWRKAEAKLKAIPQFITEIDGLDLHFIHVRSKHQNALPLVITHGWPGSILEQIKLIGPLTDPTAHGGRAEDAFHVVIPSMPGYGFTGRPTSTGWGPERMGRAWDELMQRLGYTRYVAQGGDWGAFVVDQMGLQAPRGLLAIHTNMPATVPADVDKALLAGEPHAIRSLSRRKARLRAAGAGRSSRSTTPGSWHPVPKPCTGSRIHLWDWPPGYSTTMTPMGSRRRPVFQALSRKTSATGELTRDEIFDNITLYWLTNTGVSASRLYWEYKGGFFNAKGVQIPVAVTVFPGEQYEAPRSWTERAYPKLIYYNRVDKGGHFAAWEQPMTFYRGAPGGVPIAALGNRLS